jgi:hypothetical protein
MTLKQGSTAAGIAWRKSSRSAAAGHCVEVATESDVVLVRDSKDVTGPVLRFGAPQWNAFVSAVRSGRFDRP